VMWETGQPLHAFDFDLLAKSKIIVQRARSGEKFQTLDEKEHTLQAEDLLICDGEQPVALAGIMGGLNSEVSGSTRHVLIECAYFDPLTIRRTAKRLGIKSESARRFERGTDPNGIPFVLQRAAQLMQETAGGELARGMLDVYPKTMAPVKIDFRPKRAFHLLGHKIAPKKIVSILQHLECKVVAKGASWRVTAPTFRPDLTREVDLIEEVSRVYGFDRVPIKLRSEIALVSERNPREESEEKLRQVMTGLGIDEAVTSSFLPRQHAERFFEANRQSDARTVLPLLNPLSEDLAVLRPYLISTLLQALAYNLNRKNLDTWLFEIGSVFWRESPKPICEERRLGAVFTGNAEPPSWAGKSRPLSIFDIRGLLAELGQRMRLPEFEFVPLPIHHFLTSGWQVRCANETIGLAGELSPELLHTYEIDAPVFAFEFNIEHLPQMMDWQRTVTPIPRFPAVERDIAILTPAEVAAEKVMSAIRSAAGDYLESVHLFDLYRGAQIPAGMKSLAFAMIFRAPDRTLREEEVDAWQRQILHNLKKEVGARLRE
ncbi:MAG: phenylalanine--tRNA ligase subunit beta, partial [candidate division KSB1 bacterium]|nr:phenylalanine--tRNA ligase subunit beta [candidate division KSB1 bacterium]